MRWSELEDLLGDIVLALLLLPVTLTAIVCIVFSVLKERSGQVRRM